jgi:hypothetical protein
MWSSLASGLGILHFMEVKHVAFFDDSLLVEEQVTGVLMLKERPMHILINALTLHFAEF